MLDLILTTIGVGRFGIEAEGNPIARTIFSHWGPLGLFMFKVPAILMGFIMKRGMLIFFIFLLLIVAVGPWAWVLLR